MRTALRTEAAMGVLRRLQSRQPATSTAGLADDDPQLTLIQRVGRGDQVAFGDLYDLTAPLVHGVVLKIVRDPSQAEEVVQEVFVELWRIAPCFDPAKGTVTSWVATIAHRRAVDRVRSAEATSRRDTSYHQRNRVTEHDSTAEEATQNLEARRVRQALRSLTDTQRGALELAYFGGYTHNEVSTMLGIPLGTAKTRIRDGLIRLRDTLGVDS